jgi:hypothetical protein
MLLFSSRSIAGPQNRYGRPARRFLNSRLGVQVGRADHGREKQEERHKRLLGHDLR